MAVWGSGTLEDPWKVTDWDNFVSKCNETDSGAEVRTYIEFPTHDQNGNLIPVKNRVIDLRHHEWFIGTNAADVIIDVYRYKTIKGNGWTILGMSIRNRSLFNIRSKDTNSRNRDRNFEMINLNFQNIYVHGKCILFKANNNGSRYSITGCKFSGVFDASITDIYGGTKEDTCALTYGYVNQGWNVFTACSFNFKFVSGMRIEYGAYASSDYHSNEFNNCIFNIVGKPKPTTNNILSSYSYEAGRYYLWFGSFYFCKFTGKLLLNCADTEAYEKWLGTYFNRNGSLNVIDITLEKETAQYDAFTYYYNLVYGSSNDNEVTITYFDRSDIPDTDNFRFATNKSNVFKIPADRDKMVDKEWLEVQGLWVGTAPTT